MRTFLLLSLIYITINCYAQELSVEQAALLDGIEKDQQGLINLSDQIWSFAEVAFEEDQSSAALASYAESQGFSIKMGVAGMPTAFVASYGSGQPVIGILGEFDALPGLSQKTEPTKNPVSAGAPGHGCGHNLFGVASLGAAVSIKKLMESGRITGTIKFFGTPAEEKFFGKLWMAREGYFDDLDICMDWHPSAKTEAAVQSSLALVDFIVEFTGQAAHAAADPWNGRSATDAMELYAHGINAYREHIQPTVRIHYHMQQAGNVVNVVGDYAKMWVRVRDTKRETMMPVYEHVMRMAEGAAIMANVDYDIQLVSGVHEILVNRTGGAIMQKNLELLGDINYTENELAFARKIQESTGKPQVGMDATIKPLEETKEHPGGGSTDVGDVSWIVPVVRLAATTAPKDTPWHSWAVVACGGMSIGHKGMLFATKALGLTMLDLFQSQESIDRIKAEFKERKGDYIYKGILPDGPPPLPQNAGN